MVDHRKNLAYVVTPAPDDDSHVAADALTAKQEAFAQAWARTGNKSAAYRIAYDVHPRTLPNIIWASASRLSMLPKVEARYKELQQQAALETIMSVREAFAWQVDIATADPTEISWVVARNCRYCRGVGHAYQWKDENEFITACVVALDSQASVPSDSGGHGFNGALEPVCTCTHCFGVGYRETVIADTSTLSGKARKLYAGAKMDRFGAIEVKTHDQKAAWEMVLRMLGAFKDADLRTPAERANEDAGRRAKMAENITVDNAQKEYLKFACS